jgi:hypothetical protein
MTWAWGRAKVLIKRHNVITITTTIIITIIPTHLKARHPGVYGVGGGGWRGGGVLLRRQPGRVQRQLHILRGGRCIVRRTESRRHTERSTHGSQCSRYQGVHKRLEVMERILGLRRQPGRVQRKLHILRGGTGIVLRTRLTRHTEKSAHQINSVDLKGFSSGGSQVESSGRLTILRGGMQKQVSMPHREINA